jgi:hypothetical protein
LGEFTGLFSHQAGPRLAATLVAKGSGAGVF